MRVTLKIEVVHRKHGDYLNNPDIAALAVRHNLDLYNDVQVEKLIRKTAERLEVDTIQITKAIADITAQLEYYYLQQIEAQEKEEMKKIKVLTKEEQQAATDFLQQPDLLQRINELIGKSGVTGKESNRLRMHLIFTSRKRENPLHIISLGSSGAGKSHFHEKLAELIPDEDKIESTSLTSNALYYFGEYDLQHKLILIEDMDGAEAVLYALRELISKGTLSNWCRSKTAKALPEPSRLK